MERQRMKIVITGAGGLIGWHAAVRLHAANCLARSRGVDEPYDIVTLDHAGFQNDAQLLSAITLDGSQSLDLIWTASQEIERGRTPDAAAGTST